MFEPRTDHKLNVQFQIETEAAELKNHIKKWKKKRKQLQKQSDLEYLGISKMILWIFQKP